MDGKLPYFARCRIPSAGDRPHYSQFARRVWTKKIYGVRKYSIPIGWTIYSIIEFFHHNSYAGKGDRPFHMMFVCWKGHRCYLPRKTPPSAITKYFKRSPLFRMVGPSFRSVACFIIKGACVKPSFWIIIMWEYSVLPTDSIVGLGLYRSAQNDGKY